MKTLFTLGLGFYIAREIYLKHDKQLIMEKEAQIKRRLISFLKKLEYSDKEIERHTLRIIR